MMENFGFVNQFHFDVANEKRKVFVKEVKDRAGQAFGLNPEVNGMTNHNAFNRSNEFAMQHHFRQGFHDNSYSFNKSFRDFSNGKRNANFSNAMPVSPSSMPSSVPSFATSINQQIGNNNYLLVSLQQPNGHISIKYHHQQQHQRPQPFLRLVQQGNHEIAFSTPKFPLKNSFIPATMSQSTCSPSAHEKIYSHFHQPSSFDTLPLSTTSSNSSSSSFSNNSEARYLYEKEYENEIKKNVNNATKSSTRMKRSINEVNLEQENVICSNQNCIDISADDENLHVSSTTHKKARKLNYFKDSLPHISSAPSSPGDDFSTLPLSQQAETDNANQTLSLLSSNMQPNFWTPEEDNVLISAVKLHGDENWKDIALQVEGRSPAQCQQRWSKVLVPGLRKGPWSQLEDDLLLNLAKQQIENQQKVLQSASQVLGEKIASLSDRKLTFRINWKYISERIPGRTAKQCRARWVNNLNPDLKKDKWTDEEDNKILALYDAVGSRWSYIASQLGGRSENAVKIRYISLTRCRNNQSPDSSTGSS